MKVSGGLAAGLCLMVSALPVQALTPDELFILINKNVPAGREIAEHYCVCRAVPRANILELDLPAGEDMTREQYNTRLVAPLRAALKDRRGKVKVLLSVYGVPLRVGPQELSAEEKTQLVDVKAELGKLQTEIGSEKATDSQRTLLKSLRDKQQALSYPESAAAVDSELSLLWWDNYDLRRWQVNLLNFQVPEAARREKPPVVMVARIDGPTVELVKRLVDQAVTVEQRGLVGNVYVDARGIQYNATRHNAFGYEAYDESLREMARLLDREAKLPVTLDDRSTLFAPGSCPDCALYCGWYSLANYVDSCRFVPGAVAYHIASAEAVSLRDAKSKYWCKCLLEHGVAATLGPVAEPYTVGFPKPAEFFGFLVTGQYTLVECYYKTANFTSWMTVLVGDPLYNPYKKNPKLKLEQVKPSPAGSKLGISKKPANLPPFPDRR